jgi:hypothetical protein
MESSRSLLTDAPRARCTWRAALIGAALAALAGCAGETQHDTVSPAAANAVAGPSIGWRTRLADDAVHVAITDPRRYWRVEGVDLVTPAGNALAAEEITRETDRDSDPYGYGYGGSSVGIGGGWGSRGGGGVGIGIGVPLFGSGAPAAPPPSRVLARIRLPDPAAYRQTAAGWKIRLRLSDPNGQTSHAEIPAPLPQG